MPPQYTLSTPPSVLLRHSYFHHFSVSYTGISHIASQRKLMNQSRNVLETGLLNETLAQSYLRGHCWGVLG